MCINYYINHLISLCMFCDILGQVTQHAHLQVEKLSAV